MRNEISNEVRAKEIHAKARTYYDVAEQYAYKFLMELKTLRDDKLFRELGYKTFDDYCAEEWSLTRQEINGRIKIADTFGDETESMLSKIGKEKSLLLSRFDEESRADVIENGIPTESGRKPAKEATRAEISAYQRSLKEKEAEIEAQRKAKEQAERIAEAERSHRERLEEEYERLSKEADKPPEVKTEYVEVPVRDETVEQRLKAYEERFGDIENYSDRPRATNLAEVTTSVMSFSKAVRDLAKRHAYLIQYQSTIEALDAATKREYNEAVQALYDLSKDFGAVSEDSTVIDVEYEII